MSLTSALGLENRITVSFIGAGGKTTALFRLAKELRAQDKKVLVTTTTKMFKPSKPHVERLFLVEEADAFLSASAKIPAPVVIGAGYSVDDENKLIGLPAKWLDAFAQNRQFDAILVEADGAAARLLKIPSEIEPVVPESTDLTVWVMAIKVLGKPLDPQWVHRAERACALLDVPGQTPVTVEHIVRLVEHPSGCLKGVPPSSRRVALLNQADTAAELDDARRLGKSLLDHGFSRVVLTSFLTDDPIRETVAHA
ncbi:MAG TPA: selenium cofactor biosynthesis protein YqeC [Candidatus Eisenbacteria bacterium]|nr:selenium cofactor biosynthesis protein YqeC [Candidatus Eisenbacteria bacterium]